MMLIDSSAWIEYFMGTEKGEKVRKIIDDDEQVYISPVVLAEIYSKSIRTDGKQDERRDFMVKRCVVVSIDERIAVQAAKIHAEAKKDIKNFGLADAFILATAREREIKVLTGDRHFRNFPEGVML
ncbi:MAG: type II toxin-antitoxin system VapC family toxin [Methanosarcinales archaeon Met12]|nr:MAG: type II toxin-antitoxin system VapC family toxin [Methanosarcinales archaeon Met12]